MKNIKSKNRTGKALSIVFVLLLAVGCTGKFEELNTNPHGVTDEEANADYATIAGFLGQGQRDIVPEIYSGSYQLTTNLFSDGFVGYFGLPTPFQSNSNTQTYNLLAGNWYNVVTRDRLRLMNPLYKLEQQTRNSASLQDIFAFAKLLKVSVMHRLSDRVGPTIYSKYNKPNANGGFDYDSQPDLFRYYFQDLDTAANILKTFLGKAASPAMAKADLAYDEDNYTRYLKIANTVRLRLAMRIALVDPAEAKKQGEKALDPANGGLLENTADNWYVPTVDQHPLDRLNHEWNDTRMHASMESFLKGYNDPRLAKRWLPAKDDHPAVKDQYKGLRTGIYIDGKGRYENYSQLQIQGNRTQVMVASEAWFLKAEAALRGWANAGDAKTNYEMGVRRSFEKDGLTDAEANAYLADASSMAAPYTDPKAQTPGQNDIPAGSPYLSTITIKWEESDTNDKKLERIVTQKWLAIFPDGDEAWAEYRRTGYPKLFPVVKNDSNGVIDSNTGVRRIPFAQTEYDTNRAAVEAAITLLGGPDNGGTRLWWDVPNKGF